MELAGRAERVVICNITTMYEGRGGEWKYETA